MEAIGLTEIEAAYRGGFKRIEHFQRARKSGLFPPPMREIPGAGPLWSWTQIERWLGARAGKADQRGAALDRLDGD